MIWDDFVTPMSTITVHRGGGTSAFAYAQNTIASIPFGQCGATICNHVACARLAKERSLSLVIEPAPQRDKLGRIALSSADLGVPLPAPAVRTRVPRAHDKRMGYADAPRRPCYRAPRRAP